ncbi:amidase signature domain-containing protein, partial [Phaeosphaeriaceae sp. PMI808]
RVAVKDAFDLAGVKTSMCNRAYFELYPPATHTAIAIAGLVERGIQILGKTKLSSFLSREEPSESVDYQAVWNPRGDSYQGPGGSSSGSAAAVAAYDWVDVGIGTDTNGSIRRPAQCNGVFGLRISQGVFLSTGMFTVF